MRDLESRCYIFMRRVAAVMLNNNARKDVVHKLLMWASTHSLQVPTYTAKESANLNFQRGTVKIQKKKASNL